MSADILEQSLHIERTGQVPHCFSYYQEMLLVQNAEKLDVVTY